MTLSTHAVGGAAAALIFRSNPAVAFVAAFLSHFVLDAVPHWDYSVSSISKDKTTGESSVQRGRLLVRDFAKTGLDASFGLGVVLAVANVSFGPTLFVLFLGIVGGVLPDFFQLLYHMYKKEPLVSLQRFHEKMHANLDFNDEPVLGIGSQVALISLFAVFIRVIL